MHKGVGVSRGIAIGRALVYAGKDIGFAGSVIAPDDVAKEKEKVEQAVISVRKELSGILESLRSEDEMMLDLIEIQMELTEDPMLLDKITEYIEESFLAAGDAILQSAQDMAAGFEELQNEYYRARAADIRDVGSRLAAHAFGVKRTDLSRIDYPAVIFAKDISPSDTVTMDKTKVLGFVMELGSKTSHTAILANMLGIPAVVGIVPSNVRNGALVIVDGSTGEVALNPSELEIELYEKRRQQFIDGRERLKTLRDLSAITPDGHHTQLCINIADPREASGLAEVGGDGVGLFRTEFLYMNSQTLPSEEDQFNAYKTAAAGAKGKPVVIRTLDAGGDKSLPCLPFPKEANPFLGYRAIRICLDNRELFKIQLRAILRASVFGNLKIMFPMIGSIDQLKQAKHLMEECSAELKAEGIPCADSISVGIMVEIPAAAVIAELLAPEADFFSIGTNDLCQYALAVDRTNSKISGLCSHFDPGVLRLIRHTVEAAAAAGIPVGMCGEMASDPVALPVLLGMGLDEFSVNLASLPDIKDRIRSITMDSAKEIVNKVFSMDSAAQIQDYLEGLLK